MYELFLLGKLMERPWHGYKFQRVLSSVLGPVRNVSWGTIYPLLRRMENTGLIKRVPKVTGNEDRRGRQSYAITPSGRKRFLELMQVDHRNDADYRDTFRIKVGNFNRVDESVRKIIVRRQLELLTAISRHTQAMTKLVAAAPEMGEADRTCILLALAHDRFLAESELAWIQKEMAGLFKVAPL